METENNIVNTVEDDEVNDKNILSITFFLVVVLMTL